MNKKLTLKSAVSEKCLQVGIKEQNSQVIYPNSAETYLFSFRIFLNIEYVQKAKFQPLLIYVKKGKRLNNVQHLLYLLQIDL